MNRTPLLGLGLALFIVVGALLLVRQTDPAASTDATATASPDAASSEAAATADPDAASPTARLASADADDPVVRVWKSPSCSCCGNWIAHLEDQGFTVEAQDVADIAAVKDEHDVPAGARACHTATVDGYVVEGHVPAEDIRRLLEERPEVAGLAVPGMPVGSPGMETGGQAEPYDVLTFADDGSTAVYTSH